MVSEYRREIRFFSIKKGRKSMIGTLEEMEAMSYAL